MVSERLEIFRTKFGGSNHRFERSLAVTNAADNRSPAATLNLNLPVRANVVRSANRLNRLGK
jgi:hypothetical protein